MSNCIPGGLSGSQTSHLLVHLLHNILHRISTFTLQQWKRYQKNSLRSVFKVSISSLSLICFGSCSPLPLVSPWNPRQILSYLFSSVSLMTIFPGSLQCLDKGERKSFKDGRLTVTKENFVLRPGRQRLKVDLFYRLQVGTG